MLVHQCTDVLMTKLVTCGCPYIDMVYINYWDISVARACLTQDSQFKFSPCTSFLPKSHSLEQAAGLENPPNRMA